MNRALVEMFHYNAWANRVLFQSCLALPADQLDSRPPAASGSVRELLLHIVGAQQTFILRTKGRQHEDELHRGSAWPGDDRLLELMESTNQELIAIAGRLDGEAEVDLSYQGRRYRYPLRFFLAHAIAHGIEHRTEIKMALGQIGVETPDLDGWPYSFAAGYGRVVDT